MSQGQGGGRPLSFKSVKALDEAIQQYWDIKTQEKKPFTIAGLAYHLGTDRKTLWNYRTGKSKKYKKFFHTLKKAMSRIDVQTEETLIEKGTPGSIFLAKNYGYTDRPEIETTDNEVKPITYKVTILPPKNDTDKS